MLAWCGCVGLFGMPFGSTCCQVLGFCACLPVWLALLFGGWLCGVGVVVGFRIVDASIWLMVLAFVVGVVGCNASVFVGVLGRSVDALV